MRGGASAASARPARSPILPHANAAARFLLVAHASCMRPPPVFSPLALVVFFSCFPVSLGSACAGQAPSPTAPAMPCRPTLLFSIRSCAGRWVGSSTLAVKLPFLGMPLWGEHMSCCVQVSPGGRWKTFSSAASGARQAASARRTSGASKTAVGRAGATTNWNPRDRASRWWWRSTAPHVMCTMARQANTSCMNNSTGPSEGGGGGGGVSECRCGQNEGGQTAGATLVTVRGEGRGNRGNERANVEGTRVQLRTRWTQTEQSSERICDWKNQEEYADVRECEGESSGLVGGGCGSYHRGRG